MVLVPVTVTDYNGKTVQGLSSGNFSVLEDQKLQRIVSFAWEDSPCSVGLLLDTSGSMRNTLGAAKDIANAFLEVANPEDEFQLLTVSTQPAALSGFTTDKAALEAEIDSTRPAGMTALIDTVYFALSQMRKARRPRRALLILTDGVDNYSRYSASELMRVAQEADVQVYTILFNNGSAGGPSGGALFRPSMVAKPWDRGPEQQGPEMLEKLSDKTGGLHFRARNAAEAKEAMGRAGHAIREQYVIGYQPPDPGQSGKWHRVRVKANVQKVNVYARNGYYSR
jgi:VWFA-related protein